MALFVQSGLHHLPTRDLIKGEEPHEINTNDVPAHPAARQD
jgi:hypothetical protein